jgi:type I restriction enzyme S subunit
MNVPKLRFKEFTDEWKTIRLQKIISIYKEQSTIENQYPMLTSSKQGLVLQKDYYSDNARITNRSNIGYNILPYGYITYRNRSDTGFFTFNINLKLEKGLISYFYPVFSLVNSNKYFLVNLLNAKYQFKMYAISEGTSQKVLSITNLKKLKVLCPNLKEQNKIADFLSTLDKKISNLENIITTLENQKKGLLQKIFNQELRFKDENGNNYPDWEKKKLGDISDVRDGTHDSPKYINSGYPLITSKNIQNGKISFKDINYISKEDYNNINKRSKVSIGDILMSMIGTVGNVALLSEENFAIKNVALFKEKPLLKNIFLIQYLQSNLFYKSINNLNEGGTQKFISLKNIRNLYINLPCLEEQTKIADFLSAFDRKIDNQKAQLEHWKQIKKGLLQQMFV